MSKEDLENLGIYEISSIDKRMFFLPLVGEVKIPEYYDVQHIFELIYSKGYEDGVKQGKKEKMEEIRNVLGINQD